MMDAGAVRTRRLVNQARFLDYLLKRNGSVCEIRIVAGRRWSGYFDNVKSVMEALLPVSSVPRRALPYSSWPRDGEGNIYFLLNRCDSALLSRSENRIVPATVATGDLDILEYRFILVDADPKRPAGISSSRREKRLSARTIVKIFRWLRGAGIDGHLCDSGNGYHILIPVRYPNDADSRRKVKAFLAMMARMFSTDAVEIDTTVDNPSRICKLYGTRACKGSSTSDRPHRWSSVHFRDIPDQDVFGLLAAELDVKAAGVRTVNDMMVQSNRDLHIENIRHILDANGTAFREKEKGGRTVFELESCPVHTDHDGDRYECSVIVEPDGMYSGHCFHDSSKGWKDFKAVLDFDRWKLADRKPVIPDDVTDINAFLNDTKSASAVSDFVGAGLAASDSTSALDMYRTMRDGFLLNDIPPAPECLIPAAGLFPRRCIVTVASQEGVGKSTLLVAGIILPMILGEPVMGSFKMRKVKTFYIQSDNDQSRFMNRIVLPYGYDHRRDGKWVCFFHTMNAPMQKSVANILGLIEQACLDGYEFIVVDNKTSLFPGMVYDLKHSNKDSLDFVELAKRIAMKYNASLCILEHCRKRKTEQEIITLQDVLGTGTKTIEQCLGLNGRYNRFKMEKNYEYRKRDGEAVVIPLKNAEGVEMCQCNIQIDEPHNYLNFAPYAGIYTNSSSQEEFVSSSSAILASDDSIEKIKKYLYDTGRLEWNYGEVMSETGLSRNTVKKVFFLLQGEHMIRILPSSGGQGQKTKIVLERPRADLFLVKPPVLSYISMDDALGPPPAVLSTAVPEAGSSLVDEFFKTDFFKNL